MIRTATVFFLITIFPVIAYSQEKISKQEIYNYWTKENKWRDKPENYKKQLDSLVVIFIDSLKVTGVDTVGAYQEDHVGSSVNDSCLCGIIPWIAFVQWIENGITYHQKFTECCKFIPIQIENSALIMYYNAAKTKLDNERILPRITEVTKDEKGELHYYYQMVDHTIHYTIFCDLNGHSRFTAFEEYELENKDNLFYENNVNSIINSWKKIIGNQIREIYNK